MKIVIVGNGIASYNAALNILRTVDDCTIEVFSDESFSPYYRTRVLSLLSDTADEKDLAIKPEITDERYKLVRKHVNCIDPDNKLVYSDDGEAYEYDVLVLANGASALSLVLPGGKSKGIFTVRTVDDVYSLRAWLKDHCENTVVIGGGLLGIEAAYEIHCHTGKTVTVIETFPYLLPRQLDRDSAVYLQKRLESMGLSILCGVRTSNFLYDHDECVSGVKCDDGFSIPASTIVESVGIRSNTFLAVDAGLKVSRGVVVDDYLMTSVEDIYAIGDVAETDGRVTGQVSAALDMAKVLASNIAGKKTTYRIASPSSMLKVAGLDVVSLGNVSTAGCDVIVREDDDTRCSYFIRDGLLSGAVLIGTRAQFVTVKANLNKELTAEVKAKLAL